MILPGGGLFASRYGKICDNFPPSGVDLITIFGWFGTGFAEEASFGTHAAKCSESGL
jgi:hypothetical protein